MISIHALREEGDPDVQLVDKSAKDISIHALREEGDPCPCVGPPSVKYFYPRPPRGGRRAGVHRSQFQNNFYPRPPRGGRRDINAEEYEAQLFLSTPSARRATWTPGLAARRPRISIHALREEGDSPLPPSSGNSSISIHALREEGDRWRLLLKSRHLTFLSTPSARRATPRCLLLHARVCISIHALREEGDLYGFRVVNVHGNFYPRPPRGGRQRRKILLHKRGKISIHALREEGDLFSRQAMESNESFLSTPSARRATLCQRHCDRCAGFLSTPSARRATPILGQAKDAIVDFYPRPPRGGRQAHQRARLVGCRISIHALREEGDCNTDVQPT